eukprot:5762847-Pleurochrysis_carterae.AAC.1
MSAWAAVRFARVCAGLERARARQEPREGEKRGRGRERERDAGERTTVSKYGGSDGNCQDGDGEPRAREREGLCHGQHSGDGRAVMV